MEKEYWDPKMNKAEMDDKSHVVYDISPDAQDKRIRLTGSWLSEVLDKKTNGKDIFWEICEGVVVLFDGTGFLLCHRWHDNLESEYVTEKIRKIIYRHEIGMVYFVLNNKELLLRS